jgi:hypothetical protein
MSFEPMRQSTSLYEKISEALEPIFLTQDELKNFLMLFNLIKKKMMMMKILIFKMFLKN